MPGGNFGLITFAPIKAKSNCATGISMFEDLGSVGSL